MGIHLSEWITNVTLILNNLLIQKAKTTFFVFRLFQHY